MDFSFFMPALNAIQNLYGSAVDQVRNAWSNMGNYTPEGLTVSNVEMRRMNNNNIDPFLGVAKSNAWGTEWLVPNVALSQLMYTDALNEGRSNAVSSYFGMDKVRPEGMNYTDVGASRGMMEEWWRNNPEFAKSIYANPFTEYESQKSSAMSKVQSLYHGVMKETANPTGISSPNYLQGAINEANSIQKPIDYDTRGGRVRAEEQSQEMQNRAVKETAKIISPTFSNLPIKETYIPKIF